MFLVCYSRFSFVEFLGGAILFASTVEGFQIVADGEGLKIVFSVGGDEGDVVVLGVVLIDIEHHHLVAERLRNAINLYIAEGVPATDIVAVLVALVGVD